MRLPPPLLSRYNFVPRTNLCVVIDILYRGLDPVLGVFTGFLAYYLHENHPRTALPQEQRLIELIRWKWSKWQDARNAHLNAAATTK
ncbi:hypothetical protein F5890DRAFT_1451905 [Lentinula detonsa]|uniref:Uncharacterized protein n=1 Tax=Lentinula detonsa TaxID=2804962 RepID=A0AA38UXS5_9AGAR|nr:hypothetical protein F5890DRAFT_1451905 [Lentinula detonsa]